MRQVEGVLGEWGAKRITALVEHDRPLAAQFWEAVGYPRDEHVARHVSVLDPRVAASARGCAIVVCDVSLRRAAHSAGEGQLRLALIAVCPTVVVNMLRENGERIPACPGVSLSAARVTGLRREARPARLRLASPLRWRWFKDAG